MLKYGTLFQISFKDFITPLGYNILFIKMKFGWRFVFQNLLMVIKGTIWKMNLPRNIQRLNMK